MHYNICIAECFTLKYKIMPFTRKQLVQIMANDVCAKVNNTIKEDLVKSILLRYNEKEILKEFQTHSGIELEKLSTDRYYFKSEFTQPK